MRAASARTPRLVTVRGTGGQVSWVLVAANGRPLGISAGLLPSVEGLAVALRELRSDRQELHFTLSQPVSGRAWQWTAYLPVRRSDSKERRAVARSARGYLRMDQCHRGAKGFAAALEQVNVTWLAGS